MAERVIHIQWEGPHKLEAIAELRSPSDKGLYQVYAHHPVYGHSLVYIGKTCTSFAERIAGRPLEQQFEQGSENDPAKVQYYIGRLTGVGTPEVSQWNDDIGLTEKLLIHAHAPVRSWADQGKS